MFKNILQCSFLFLCFSAYAKEYPSGYRSAYFLGRGDTGIASPHVEESIFYNPAGISVGKGVYKKIIIASPMLEISDDTKNVAHEIYLQERKPSDTILNHRGKPQSFSLNTLTAIVLRKVAISAYTMSRFSMMLSKSKEYAAFEQVSAKSQSDLAANFTLGDKLFSKNWHAGVTFQYLVRTQVGVTAVGSELSQLDKIEESAEKGVGRALRKNFGILYLKQTKKSDFSFGLTINDLGSTSFDKLEEKEDSDNPLAEIPTLDSIPQTINLGLALTPKSYASKMRFLLDIWDIADVYGFSLAKRIHFGMELSVKDAVGFCVGLNQGYPTLGFYASIKLLRIDIGSYGEEIGETAGERVDQRIYFRLTVGL